MKEMKEKITNCLKKNKIQGRIRIDKNKKLILTLTKGEIDFDEFLLVDNHPTEKMDFIVSKFWYKNHYFGKVVVMLEELFQIMEETGMEYTVKIGTWRKPYVVQ